MVPLATQMWDVEKTGDSTLYAVPGLGRSTVMEQDHFKGSPTQSWSGARSLFLWGVLQMPACTGWSMFGTDGVFEEFS